MAISMAQAASPPLISPLKAALPRQMVVMLGAALMAEVEEVGVIMVDVVAVVMVRLVDLMYLQQLAFLHNIKS